MKITRLALSFGLAFFTSACVAQMYTVTNLGSLGGTQSYATGVNNSGQVAGYSTLPGDATVGAFRTEPNSPVNPATDNLGTLGGDSSILIASGINSSGQVVGLSEGFFSHGFRTAPNRPINPATDDLGALGAGITAAHAINDSGQAAGESDIGGLTFHAFRTAPNALINPATDDLGSLGGGESWANGINASGQVAGQSFINGAVHAYRTAANRPIDPATDDLGTLGGANSEALGLNAFGQVVGSAITTANASVHAYRTGANRAINSATDDLGTLGGQFSEAAAIDPFGQVVGLSYTAGNDQHAFLFSNGVMQDLNSLIPTSSNCLLSAAAAMNLGGQIAASANCSGQLRAVLLTPIYLGFVKPPINRDGSSVFKANRGALPVKFSLTQSGIDTCVLPPATIALTKASGGTLISIPESIYSTPADNGSEFRIDPTACQYVYNLAASKLGAGTYRIDISINGVMVGHAVFALTSGKCDQQR